MQAVPTTREHSEDGAGGADAFQYTAHHHTKQATDTLPAVVFIYEFAPFRVSVPRAYRQCTQPRGLRTRGVPTRHCYRNQLKLHLTVVTGAE
jgi:hypothetical protein